VRGESWQTQQQADRRELLPDLATSWSVTDDGGGELGPDRNPLDAALVDHADEDRCTSTTQA
jgi:uncharacterized protein (DUF2235 family)